MREEVVRALMLHRPHAIIVDCTVGGGGHAEAILEASAPDGGLIGIDQDEEAIRGAAARLKGYGNRVHLFCEKFNNLRTILAAQKIRGVDGILMDLGVSTAQLMNPDRGFGFQKDGPLDMRMDRRSEVTAADLVNTLPTHRLERLLFEYGEERWARRIARAITEERKKRRIATTLQMAGVITCAIPRAARSRRLHPATKAFQALRIAVNHELESLTDALAGAAACLNPGGRLCVIAFHSLEDRIVKRTFKALAEDESARVRLVTKKPMVPDREEIRMNPRSRSAKLRVVECVIGQPTQNRQGMA